MDTTLIAVPSEMPGGLFAPVSQRFGHCPLYTLVEVADGEVTKVSTMPNVPHQHGGCMAPVNHLAESGVNVLIAGGMGMRPLMGFAQTGIKVFHGAGAPSVSKAVEDFLAGALRQFSTDFVCGGGENCGSHHHG